MPSGAEPHRARDASSCLLARSVTWRCPRGQGRRSPVLTQDLTDGMHAVRREGWRAPGYWQEQDGAWRPITASATPGDDTELHESAIGHDDHGPSAAVGDHVGELR